MFRRGKPFVRARDETSSTCGASHLRAGLSWPSHVHIQPNLLKSCQEDQGNIPETTLQGDPTYNDTISRDGKRHAAEFLSR